MELKPTAAALVPLASRGRRIIGDPMDTKTKYKYWLGTWVLNVTRGKSKLLLHHGRQALHCIMAGRMANYF